MDSEDTITRRRALLAGGGTLAFGGGVAYYASGSDRSSEPATSDADYSPATFDTNNSSNATREGTEASSEETATEETAGEETETEDTPEETNDGTTGYGIDLAGRPVAGDPEAPVDVYYWTEYLCSFCKRFETETFPKLVDEYVDTGQVRLVVLGYPIMDDYSMPAIVWSRCVWRQVADSDPAAFWDWHRAVFDAQSTDGHDWADDETFAAITDRTEGVPLEAVEECRESRRDELVQSIEADLAAGQEAGVEGTPGFVMYHRKSGDVNTVAGAQPYENFAEAIDGLTDG